MPNDEQIKNREWATEGERTNKRKKPARSCTLRHVDAGIDASAPFTMNEEEQKCRTRVPRREEDKAKRKNKKEEEEKNKENKIHVHHTSLSEFLLCFS